MKKLLIILACVALPTAALAEDPDQIIIPHDVHFEAELECTDCHAAVTTSTQAVDSLRPDMDVCGECHEVEDEDNCTLCHTNVNLAGETEYPVYGAARFTHAAHLDNGLECRQCHGDPMAAQPTLPGKPDCRGCHETADDLNDCLLCHAADYQLQPASHSTTWQNNHGLAARDDQGRCYQCHTENTCLECHSGDNVRPRSHNLNYVYGHALDARGNEMQCATCHLEPTYCSSCHLAERVLPLNHSSAGWVSLSGGGLHATEAVFDLENCIACHDAGADDPSCARCHSGG